MDSASIQEYTMFCMNTSLSLCLIVRNEEVHMHRVLRNASLYADEIVIINIGSTDRTKDIAMQYTQLVYDFPDPNDFSAARNFGIRKCTKDFIIYLDADDIILDKDALRIKDFLSQNPADVYFSPYHYRYHKNDKIVRLLRERIFRNNKYIFFKYPVYESLYSSAEVTDTIIDIAVYHRNINVLDSKKRSLLRNLSILLPALEKKEYTEDMFLWKDFSINYVFYY